MRWIFESGLKRCAIFAASFFFLTSGLAACSDEVDQDGESREAECAPHQEWNPIQGVCVDGSGDPDDDAGGFGEPDGDGGGSSCENLECQQVLCDTPGTLTSISGRVTIPSGELPLPDVSVFVPNENPGPIVDGVSCEQCSDELDGAPLVETLTDLDGTFRLRDAPVGESIPLVIQVGKWRRQITVANVEPCQDNPITDESLTRLPRNQDEGDLPRIAVTTGGWDALECLVRKIGVSESEFTTEDGEGRIHLFAGRGGTDSFSSNLNGGASFTPAWEWWDDLDNLINYDIIMHSCEGAANGDDKSDQARHALRDFTHLGGRAFLSHWHNVWLQSGPSEFQTVADWSAPMVGENETGLIDTSFPKGEMLRDWMVETGSSTSGQFEINEARGTVGSVNEEVAQQWVWVETEPDPFFGIGGGPSTQYFTFNTPVGAPETQQCGRIVFSDIHVAAGDDSDPSNPFPTGCGDGPLTDQEKALVFMFFDLSRCIIPDHKKGH